MGITQGQCTQNTSQGCELLSTPDQIGCRWPDLDSASKQSTTPGIPQHHGLQFLAGHALRVAGQGQGRSAAVSRTDNKLAQHCTSLSLYAWLPEHAMSWGCQSP